jgi:hypothetical protein
MLMEIQVLSLEVYKCVAAIHIHKHLDHLFRKSSNNSTNLKIQYILTRQKAIVTVKGQIQTLQTTLGRNKKPAYSLSLKNDHTLSQNKMKDFINMETTNFTSLN